jgi:hypothetical protein
MIQIRIERAPTQTGRAFSWFAYCHTEPIKRGYECFSSLCKLTEFYKTVDLQKTEERQAGYPVYTAWISEDFIVKGN